MSKYTRAEAFWALGYTWHAALGLACGDLVQVVNYVPNDKSWW